jgi:cell division GTPase FtsZ
MKLVVIGLGQCGGRIADEFARLNLRAHHMRGMDILVDSFAVNSDATDLAGIVTIKPDHNHRILIGAGITHGHGVAKVSEVGAEIAKKDGDKVMDALRKSPKLFETDAFLIIAATGGGTGSGAAPVIATILKERFNDMPVYVMAVLPFEHEETNEERAVFNTAVCLKSLNMVADAVILVDNQRYVRKDSSIQNNIIKINRLIVEPFFNLLCAGEEKKPINIGAKVLDAGDIIQTLYGWSAIGYGQILKPLITMPTDESRHFIKRGTSTGEGVQSIDEAVAELSISTNPSEAHRALFLVSAPAKELSTNLIQNLGDYMRMMCPHAVIRSGDYPRDKGMLDVTIILSEFGDVEKVQGFYNKSAKLLRDYESRRHERAVMLELTSEASKDVPTLL